MSHPPTVPAPRRTSHLGGTLAALATTGVALGSVPPYLTWDLDANRIPLNAEVTWHFLSIAAHAVPSSLALLIGPV